MNKDTFSSWVFRKRTPAVSKKNDNFAESETKKSVKKSELSPEAMEVRIQELEHQLAKEKMRAECLEKMIEIANREFKVDIRKKTGARQSLR